MNIWFSAGENAILSNLHERHFVYQGRHYRSVEHAYQTLKSGEFDAVAYDKGNAGVKKPVGVKKVNAEISEQLMKALVKASFEQDEAARKALLATGDETLTHNQDKGFWETAFPRILMEVRQEMKTPSLAGTSDGNAQSTMNTLS